MLKDRERGQIHITVFIWKLEYIHFLFECGDFSQVRHNYFHIDNMKQLFQDMNIDSIIIFLNEINILIQFNPGFWSRELF